MIQRIQTIYLILIAGLMLAMVFLPIAVQSILSWLFFIYCCVIALFSFMAIFLYRKRYLQLKLCYLIFFMLFIAGIFMFFSSKIFPVDNTPPHFQFSILSALPIVAVILDGLAIRGIKKDEKLVRSLDRLR